MKGADIVLEASWQLANRPGWRIVAYGLPDEGRLGGGPIEARPPFAEHELPSVLAEADVLLLPSVMRESFSIVTREALSAGVPVIATDTLGPEEVVEEGTNGLIIPAADSKALANAMALVLDSPGLLHRLRNGCHVPSFRTVAAQASGLETRYAQLLTRRDNNLDGAVDGRTKSLPASLRARPIHHVVFAVGIDGAPLRYRAHLPAESLGLLGVQCEVRHYRDPELPDLLAEADAAVFYRVPATVQVVDMISGVRRRCCPVVFDVDDLIFDPDIAAEIPALSVLPPAESALWLEGVRRYRTTMEACDLFVGSTLALCRHAAGVTGLPVEHFANGVGILLAVRSEQARRDRRPNGPLRIGYFSGTTTHDRDWAYIEPAVLEILARFNDVELWLGGYITPSAALGRVEKRVRRLQLLPWSELPFALRSIDINLAPLEPGSRFNDAKSAIKWLEAALVDTPTVASPTEPFREAIRAWETGVLAGSPGEWVDAIDLLLRDERLRDSLARRARRDALLRWSPHLQGRRYLAILERAALIATTGRQTGRASSWVPTMSDEPSVASPLAPYSLGSLTPTAPDGGSRAPAELARLLELSRRAISTARHNGVKFAVRRAAVHLRQTGAQLKHATTTRWARWHDRAR
jgi:glycosyltransferase involved in cell wall biosynthesis